MSFEIGEKLTVKDLQSYQQLKKKIRACEAEIESLYDTYKSPTGTGDSGKKSVRDNSNPVLKAFRKIDERKDELEGLKHTLENQAYRIRNFIDEIDDIEVSSIAQTHYLAGKSWKETTVQIYGNNANVDLARMIFNRWVAKNMKSVRFDTK